MGQRWPIIPGRGSARVVLRRSPILLDDLSNVVVKFRVSQNVLQTQNYFCRITIRTFVLTVLAYISVLRGEAAHD